MNHYQKPQYDPWTLFNPPKSFIKERIKYLNQKAYEYLKISRIQDEFTQMYFRANLLPEKDKLERRIREYRFRLMVNVSKRPGTLTNEHVVRAKEQSITNYYTGKLRKAGKDLTGLCPFHNDKHASFTIYKDGHRYKCFSCGAEGDTIDFVRKTHNISFVQAIKLILGI